MFMAACIGAKNHRFYTQLLFYGIIAGVFTITQNLLWFSMTGKSLKESNEFGAFAAKMSLFSLFLAFLFIYTLICIYLFFYHLKIIFFNMTTIEDIKGVNKGLYDFGLIYNIKSFFGNWRLAFLPFNRRTKHEGFYYYRAAHDSVIDHMPLAPLQEENEKIDGYSIGLDTYVDILKMTASSIPPCVTYKFNDYTF